MLLLIAGLTVVWPLARSRPRLHPRRLSQPGGVALGTQAGEARLTDVLRDGGFTRVRRVAETPLNLVLEARP